MVTAIVTFLVACLLVAMVPGPSTAVILRQAVVEGRRSAFAATLGNETGLLLWAIAAAFGITALVTASELAYDALRVGGGVVLVFMGVQALRRARRITTTPPDTTADTTGGIGTTADSATELAAAPDGASADGTALDGASADGTALDGASADGTAPDGAAPDGAAPDGAWADRASADRARVDGVPADGARADGVPADAVRADGVPAGGETAGGETAGGETAGGSDGGGRRRGGAWRSYRLGVVTAVANAKAGVFAMAFLPQFVPDGAPALPVLLGLTLVWGLVDLVWYGLLIWAAGRARKALSRPAARRVLERVSGVVLVTLGLRLAAEAR